MYVAHICYIGICPLCYKVILTYSILSYIHYYSNSAILLILYCSLHLYACMYIITGASPGFGRGGGQEIFFSDLGICMSRSDMLRMAKPCALLGGFGGMLPRENFFKTVQFGAF